jgi:hypothetical protein
VGLLSRNDEELVEGVACDVRAERDVIKKFTPAMRQAMAMGRMSK